MAKMEHYVDIGGGVLVPSVVALDLSGNAIGATVGQKAMAASSPVVLASDQSAVAVKGDTLPILGTISGVSTLTRPADTSPYASGDEISNSTTQGSAVPFVFANAGRVSGGSGYVTKVRLGCSDKLNVAATFRLYLFNATPTMVGDNALYNLLKSEFASRVGFFDLGPLVTGAGASSDGASIDVDVRKSYVCAGGATSLYGILLATAAYTPLSQGTFQVEITCERN